MKWWTASWCDVSTASGSASTPIATAREKMCNRCSMRTLADINASRCTPESTGSVATYVEKHFLPYADAELKPSTRRHYRAIWNTYLKGQPQVQDIPLRDFRCVHVTQMLAGIHRKHGLSRKSLRHCKRNAQQFVRSCARERHY